MDLILKRLFPKGVEHETRPRGPMPLERHTDLIQRFKQTAESGELDRLKKQLPEIATAIGGTWRMLMR